MAPHPLERPARADERKHEDEARAHYDEVERASFDRTLTAHELQTWLLLLGARM